MKKNKDIMMADSLMWMFKQGFLSGIMLYNPDRNAQMVYDEHEGEGKDCWLRFTKPKKGGKK